MESHKIKATREYHPEELPNLQFFVEDTNDREQSTLKYIKSFPFAVVIMNKDFKPMFNGHKQMKKTLARFATWNEAARRVSYEQLKLVRRKKLAHKSSRPDLYPDQKLLKPVSYMR